MMLLSVAAAVYLAQLSLLLWVAYSEKQFHHYTAAKAATSAGFLLLALLAWLTGSRSVSYTHLSTVMVWSVSLNSSTLLKCLRMSSVMPPFMASTPRVTLEPPP